MAPSILRTALVGLLAISPSICSAGRVWDFVADGGAVPDTSDLATEWLNGAAFNSTLSKLQSGDTLRVPNKTFHVMGGIEVRDLASA